MVHLAGGHTQRLRALLPLHGCLPFSPQYRMWRDFSDPAYLGPRIMGPLVVGFILMRCTRLRAPGTSTYIGLTPEHVLEKCTPAGGCSMPTRLLGD